MEKKPTSPADGKGEGRPGHRSGGSSTQLCPMCLVPVPGRLNHTTQLPAGAGVGAARGGGGGRNVAFVPDAGARRALGLFPRHFPVTFQRGGQFRGGPCSRPLHKSPAQPAATALYQPQTLSVPCRATMRGVRCPGLLGETSGLRGAGRELAGRGQEGQGQSKPAHLCAPEGSPGGVRS